MTEVQNDDHIFHRTLKQQWQQISHGEGIYLFDTEGKRYLDACAGGACRQYRSRYQRDC